MKLLPKNEHLGVAMYINALIGVWPTINNTKMKKYYGIYSTIVCTYFITFLTKSYIQLYSLLTSKVIEIKQVSENLATTLLCSIAIMRVYAMKTKKMLNIISVIIQAENRITDSGIIEEINIYKAYAYQSKISNAIFLVCLFFVTTLYFVRPKFIEAEVVINEVTNETTFIRPFPLSSWFPYDEQKHYVFSYIWQLIDGTIAASFVTYTDCLIFSLIIFPLGQIKILNYKLSNFDKYIETFTTTTSASFDKSSYHIFRKCIINHQTIIRYIDEFNQIFGSIMLLDFLQSSLQLACILIELATMANFNLVSTLNSAQFAVSMLIRLLVYYWYANEIIYESSNIIRSIHMSKWEDQPKTVKTMMIIMMIRSTIPLSLRMSSFGTMSLETFVKILKGAYTYLMFVIRARK